MSRWKTGAQVMTLQLVAMASAHCGTSRLHPICLGCRPGDRHWAKIERPERCLDATVWVDRATRQEYDINCLTPATGPGTSSVGSHTLFGVLCRLDRRVGADMSEPVDQADGVVLLRVCVHAWSPPPRGTAAHSTARPFGPMFGPVYM